MKTGTQDIAIIPALNPGEGVQFFATPVQVKIRPIPKALYSCYHCSIDHSWPAEDLAWTDKLETWVCRECWDHDAHGERGDSLADEMRKQQAGSTASEARP